MKLEVEKVPHLPCKDCLIFPICNSIIRSTPSPDSYTLFKLYSKCELIRNFVSKKENKPFLIAGQNQNDMFYEEINISNEKIVLVSEYFNVKVPTELIFFKPLT